MRPRKPKVTQEGDLFRARLDQIISMKHELVQLAGKMTGRSMARSLRSIATRGGLGSRPGSSSGCSCSSTSTACPTRPCAIAGFMIRISSTSPARRFSSTSSRKRADLSHWRKRLGDKLELLLAESSSVKGRPQHRRAAHTRSKTGHGGHHRVLASDADQREQGRTPGIGEGSSHPMGSCRAPILFCGASRSITHPDSSLGLKARRIDPSAAPSKLGAV